MDEKALKILFDTYWSSQGWKSDQTTSPEDLEYAINAGYMFEPREVSHDDAVDWITKSVSSISPSEVAASFLASLSTRRLEMRSALGSYAVARNFPIHSFEPIRRGYANCRICGGSMWSYDEDNVFNFERHKWGGVRHLDPFYIAFDLKQFLKMPSVSPAPEDSALFDKIIETVTHMDASARARDLERALGRVLKSNRSERENLMEILGNCSILESPRHPGFLKQFILETERISPPAGKIDWQYPVSWWRGENGINQGALAFFFPEQTELQSGNQLTK